MIDTIVVHYAEIGLKGKNRVHFEKKLMDNIKIKLGKIATSFTREAGQLTIGIKTKDLKKVEDIMTKIPGVAYFSFAKKCELKKEAIVKEALNFVKDIDFQTFKVDTKRHDKAVSLRSQELNEAVADQIIERYNKKAKMKDNDLMLRIDMSSNNAYISGKKITGVGGMPTDKRNKVVSLLSGGFDSPIAAYMMMKRGCEVILVHFQNQNQMKDSVQDKIMQITKQLSKFQIKTKLYIIPFENLQRQIISKCPSAIRMLVYRRFMIKIASEIALKEKARFLVTGDCLSQVSSQTIENLETVYADSPKPIFSPLIGLNKTEVMDVARRIGTYDLSSLPYGDCCSFFMPKHPELKANAYQLKKAEEVFDVEELMNKVVDDSKVMDIQD